MHSLKKTMRQPLLLSMLATVLSFDIQHHRISLGLVHELCLSDDITLRHIGTDLQKADLMTKPLDRCKLDAAREMVGLIRVV